MDVNSSNSSKQSSEKSSFVSVSDSSSSSREGSISQKSTDSRESAPTTNWVKSKSEMNERNMLKKLVRNKPVAAMEECEVISEYSSNSYLSRVFDSFQEIAIAAKRSDYVSSEIPMEAQKLFESATNLFADNSIIINNNKGGATRKRTVLRDKSSHSKNNVVIKAKPDKKGKREWNAQTQEDWDNNNSSGHMNISDTDNIHRIDDNKIINVPDEFENVAVNDLNDVQGDMYDDIENDNEENLNEDDREFEVEDENNGFFGYIFNLFTFEDIYPAKSSPEEKLMIYFSRRDLPKYKANFFECVGLTLCSGLLGPFFGWNEGLTKGGVGGLLISIWLAAVMYLCLSLCLAEMSVSIPVVGGGFAYARVSHLVTYFFLLIWVKSPFSEYGGHFLLE
jgi:hypothetical protein